MLMAALLVTRCLQSFPNPFCCASSCVLLSVIAGQEQLMMVVTFLVTCCLHSFPNPFHQLQFKWIRFHSYFHKLIRFHSYLHLLMFYQSVVVHKHVLLKVCFILKWAFFLMVCVNMCFDLVNTQVCFDLVNTEVCFDLVNTECVLTWWIQSVSWPDEYTGTWHHGDCKFVPNYWFACLSWFCFAFVPPFWCLSILLYCLRVFVVLIYLKNNLGLFLWQGQFMIGCARRL